MHKIRRPDAQYAPTSRFLITSHSRKTLPPISADFNSLQNPIFYSVLFDSLAPAHLTLRANLRLLYLKGPAFSIVVNYAGFPSLWPVRRGF